MHKALTITYADHPFTDYDGLATTTRVYAAKINGVHTGMSVSCPTTAVDADMRQALRDLLTNKGFSWDSES